MFEHRERVDVAGVDTSPETKAPRLMPADKVVAKRSSVGAGETQDRWQHRIGVRFGLDEAVAGKHAEGVATLDGAQIGERLGEADIDTTRRHRERVEHRECLGTQHAHAAPDRRSHRVFAVTRRTGRAQPDRGRAGGGDSDGERDAARVVHDPLNKVGRRVEHRRGTT